MPNTTRGSSNEWGLTVIRVIKTESDYAVALAEIERLVDLDPNAGTPEAEKLELLTLLVQDYESKNFPINTPSPIEAIRFRMEQQGLSPRDLVPYIGSRSKVSEVLSGKRPLTLSMIRALHSGLGIPTKVLLQDRNQSALSGDGLEWRRFPIREMIKRGWLQGNVSNVEEALRRFLAPLGRSPAFAVYRKTCNVRSARSMDRYALMAWTARVMRRASADRPSSAYNRGTVDLEFMRNVTRLSWSERGPVLAQEFLGKHGIPLVIEPNLPRTYLDGVAMLLEDGTPVVALTLRHDRLDNFWFCVMHELAHVALHLETGNECFYDDLDLWKVRDPREREADKLAGEALIPEAAWKTSPASRLRSAEAAQHLAAQLRIHPAIIAGRMRYEWKNFRLLNHLVGRGEVRNWFSGSTTAVGDGK